MVIFGGTLHAMHILHSPTHRLGSAHLHLLQTQHLRRELLYTNLPAVGQVQVGERSQGGQLRQAGVGEMPAIAGLQVLQRGQPRAVLQRSVRQPLVALPAAPQLLRASQEQPLQLGRRGNAFTDRLSTHLPCQLTGRILGTISPTSNPSANKGD